jgi:hypothetical protein
MREDAMEELWGGLGGSDVRVVPEAEVVRRAVRMRRRRRAVVTGGSLLVTLAIVVAVVVGFGGQQGEVIDQRPPVPPGQELRSDEYGVTFTVPDSWTPTAGYDGNAWSGPGGFVVLGAASGGQTLEESARTQADHHLRPFGTAPTIEPLTVAGRPARLVLPSADAPPLLQDRSPALVLVTYPRPVTIGSGTYAYLSLTADAEHVRAIADSIRWPRS